MAVKLIRDIENDPRVNQDYCVVWCRKPSGKWKLYRECMRFEALEMLNHKFSNLIDGVEYKIFNEGYDPNFNEMPELMQSVA